MDGTKIYFSLLLKLSHFGQIGSVANYQNLGQSCLGWARDYWQNWNFDKYPVWSNHTSP